MHTDNHRMSNHAQLTNGHWTLPRHANGVLREEDIRVPSGERGYVVAANGGSVVVPDGRTLAPREDVEDGWAFR